MRRGSIFALLGISVVAGGIAAAVAILLPWLPNSASEQANRIDFVFWFVIAICIAIFAIVVAVIVYAAVRFRVREDDFEDGPPVHGHTGLEITWTAIPLVLVTAIAIVSAIVLSRNDAQAQDTLRVNVTAQQFAFTFGYPDAKNVTSPELRLPEGRSVELYMRSLDVIHSVFVPQFGVKMDVVPGLVTQLHITPNRLGTFPLECTELCGLGHSLMRTQAIVMKPAEFDAWLRQQEKAAAPASSSSSSSSAASGLSVFNANSCSSCHTLTGPI
jgi:cytochrome c oxidase subunit 2